MLRTGFCATTVLIAVLSASVCGASAETFKFEARGFIVGATPACLMPGATLHLPISGVFLASDAGEDQRWLIMSPTDQGPQFATVINATGPFTSAFADVNGTALNMAGSQNYAAKAKMSAPQTIGVLTQFARVALDVKTFLGVSGCRAKINMWLSRLPG